MSAPLSPRRPIAPVEALDVEAVDVDGDPDQRRRRAIAVALDRLAPVGGVDPDSWAPQVAICRFGPGAAVVALGGAFDRMGLEVLRGVTERIDTLAAEELVVEMSRTTGCDDAVARLVARWRIRRLAAGARVELHGVPAALRAELGQHPTPF